MSPVSPFLKLLAILILYLRVEKVWIDHSDSLGLAREVTAASSPTTVNVSAHHSLQRGFQKKRR